MIDKKQEPSAEKTTCLSKIGVQRSKLVYEAFQEEPDDREMLFQAAAMCQVYLPRREPGLQPHEPW